MDTKLLEELLYENEGTTLDFKQEQYPFEKASDKEKAELLKDILSFANSWRRTDAYILIGIQEVKGGKSNVIGITQHLEEASLQQFVNSKTNRPVSFSYEAFTFEEKQIGIIRIPIQERPIFLKRDFGKLPKDIVYIRRGSSTDIANPDEIAKMGVATFEAKQAPILDLQFAERNTKAVLGNHLNLTPEFLLTPDKSDIPEITSGYRSHLERINSDYYREFSEYLFMKSLLAPVSFVIFNGSTTLATNVRIHITQPKLDGLVFLDSSDYPEKPRYSGIGPVSTAFRGFQNAFDQIGTYMEDIGEAWEITIKLGNVQPGAKEWSDVFYVGAAQPCTLKLAPIIYADNLSNPLQLQLELSLTPQERSISLDELISIADIEANR